MQRLTKQTRNFTASPAVRTDEDGELYISGHFAVFRSIYDICPGYTETIAEGAFDDTLDDDIRALVNHDTTLVLGRTKAGTLTLKTDEKGLFGEIKINRNDRAAMDLYERVKRGDVDQCSFGFDILDEDFDKGNLRWTIKKVKLYEVSVVTFAAYEDTSVTARSRQLAQMKKRENESFRKTMIEKLKGEK